MIALYSHMEKAVLDHVRELRKHMQEDDVVDNSITNRV